MPQTSLPAVPPRPSRLANAMGGKGLFEDWGPVIPDGMKRF